jgi:hypothetical protein
MLLWRHWRCLWGWVLHSARSAEVREGLLAMAVGMGLQVMSAMMNADVAAVCGLRGRDDPNRVWCGTATK